jgi:hypothetical protein
MLNRERSTSDADEGSASETDADGFETALQLGAAAVHSQRAGRVLQTGA